MKQLSLTQNPQALQSFWRACWGVIVFVIAVIVWGAFVRATGSGAGCGSHWPLCNGTVVPRAAEVQTWIEFSHRLTSGLSLLAVVALAWVAKRGFPQGHWCRKAAFWSVVAMFLEAGIGAGIVLLRLTDTDASVLRAISISLHLVNTSFLMAALVAIPFGVYRSEPRLLSRSSRFRFQMLLVVLGFVLLGMSGAIAALGDTLFRPESWRAGWQADWSRESHFLERLRVVHPFLAVLWGLGTVGWILRWRDRSQSETKEPQRLQGLQFSGNSAWRFIAANLALGLLNIALLAPVGLQLAHLFLAQMIWISLVWFLLELASILPEESLLKKEWGVAQRMSAKSHAD